jgi:PAS domain S-box-containing protein
VSDFSADKLFPVTWPLFLRDGIYSFASLDELPEQAGRDRQSFEQYGVLSNISLAVNVGGTLTYVFSLGAAREERTWPSDLIPRIQLVGEVLANALAHSFSEEELARMEVKYRTVADFTYDWAYWEDPEGRLVYVSPSCERISGYAPQEFCDRPSLLRELILEEDRPAWDRHMRFNKEASTGGEIQIRIRSRNGEVRWLEHACQPVREPEGTFLGFRASNRDVTDRKRAEEEVVLREQRLAEAQRIAHLGSWEWDMVYDELSWSDEVYRIFGLQPQEFDASYEAFLSSVHPQDRKAVTAAVERVIADPIERYSIEHRVVRPDGSERIVHERGEVTVDGEGKPVRMIGTVHDITETKAMEAESRRLRAHLAHMDRVGTVGALTAAIAHETNQPLAAILTNAQAALRLMSTDTPDLEEVRSALEDIVADDKRAGKVIHGLRAMVKKQERQSQPYDLNGIIREVLSLIHSEIVIRKASVTTSLEPGIPMIHGDPVQIQQVIMNLLINALDAVMAKTTAARYIFVSTGTESDDGIKVNVADSGPGIDPEKIDSIFHSFFTTKAAGMGLGLTICRSIIEEHEGRLWVENRPHGGARFSFWLPLGEPR